MDLLRQLMLAGLGTGFIFIMSALGAALVFCFSGEIKRQYRILLLGFAGGVMTAASVWSLLIPAMEQADSTAPLPGWLTAALGLLCGALFLAGLDGLISRSGRGQNDIDPASTLLFTAITLHNIPEGMAVGLAFALAADGEGIAAAAALSLGIGIQNLPESAAVTLPLRHLGFSRSRAFLAGLLSASVEPLFGMGVVLIAALVHPLMPWFLSFAAGAMLYVTAHELLPESQGRGGSFSYIAGFLLMMVLDVALG